MAKSCSSNLPGVRRKAIARCRRCPRLVDWIDQQRQKEPLHHNGPVPDRGAVTARILLVGLAPGRLGANRTGKVFVGDSSSDFLFSALYAEGLANSLDPARAKLLGVRLTNVVKCLPPKNQPVRQEIENCSDHLRAELNQFWSARAKAPRVLVTLGGLAHRALWQALPDELKQGRSCPVFGHGEHSQIVPRLSLISCFHPSKLNTQTGRLTQPMLQSVLRLARLEVALGHDKHL